MAQQAKIDKLHKRFGELNGRTRLAIEVRPSSKQNLEQCRNQTYRALESAQQEAIEYDGQKFSLGKWWKDLQDPDLPEHQKCLKMMQDLENQLDLLDKESLSAVQMA